MKSLDIKNLGLEREMLDEILSEPVIAIEDDGEPLFYLVPAETYDSDVLGLNDDTVSDLSSQELTPNVKIIGPEGASLTYEQYMLAREQLISTFDKFFKPDAEKMN